jgi:hypothetical protein
MLLQQLNYLVKMLGQGAMTTAPALVASGWLDSKPSSGGKRKQQMVVRLAVDCNALPYLLRERHRTRSGQMSCPTWPRQTINSSGAMFK